MVRSTPKDVMRTELTPDKDMINLEPIRDAFTKAGWKDVHAGNHNGICFDLIGSRRFTITKWNVLVKALQLLDRDMLALWQGRFEALSKASKSLLVGKCFLLCLIVEEISLDVIEAFEDDDFGLLGVARLRGGGGKIIVASFNSKQVYGKVPLLPYDARKYMRDAIGILRRIVQSSGNSQLATVVTVSNDSTEAPVHQYRGRHIVFISYSRQDEPQKDQLLTHLRVLEKVGLIKLWTDDGIAPGARWEEDIAHAISSCKVALVLVTAHSLTSDFILGNELPAILERKRREGLVVIPIIAKACAWRAVNWLKTMNVSPRGGRPVWGNGDPDVALALIAEQVATIVGQTDGE